MSCTYLYLLPLFWGVLGVQELQKQAYFCKFAYSTGTNPTLSAIHFTP